MLLGVRMGYSEREKQKIVDYIIKKKAHDRIKAGSLYKEMVADNVVPQRTYRSLQAVFRNHIIAKINNYCDAKQCQIFNRVWQKTRATRKKPNTQRPALPTWEEDSEDEDVMVLENVRPRVQTNLSNWVQHRPRTQPANQQNTSQQRPQTQAANQQNAAQYSRPGTSQQNRPGTSHHSRPETIQQNRPGTSHHSRSETTQQNRPGTSQQNRPGTSHHSRSETIQQNRPGTSQQNRPGTSHHSRSETTQQNRPGTSHHSRPETIQQNRPSTSQQQIPSTSRPTTQDAQTQGKPNVKVFAKSQGIRLVPMRLVHRKREQNYEEDVEWLPNDRQMYSATFVGPNVEKYSPLEDKALINFLNSKTKNIEDLKYDENWREFNTSATIPGRSWQSLKSRYYELKKARNLDHLQLPVPTLKRLNLPCKTSNPVEKPQPLSWSKPTNQPAAPKAPSYHLADDEALNSLLQEDDTPDLTNRQPRAIQRQPAVRQRRPERRVSPVYQGSQPEDGHISPPRNSQRSTDTTTYQPRAIQRQPAVRQRRPERRVSPGYQGSQPEDGHISPPRNSQQGTAATTYQPRAIQRQQTVHQSRQERHVSEDLGHISPPRNSQQRAVHNQRSQHQNNNIVDHVQWWLKEQNETNSNQHTSIDKVEISNALHEESQPESLSSSASLRGVSPNSVEADSPTPSFVADSQPNPVDKTQNQTFSKPNRKPPEPKLPAKPPNQREISSAMTMKSEATDFRNALTSNHPHIQKAFKTYQESCKFKLDGVSSDDSDFNPDKIEEYCSKRRRVFPEDIGFKRPRPMEDKNSDEDSDDSQAIIPAPYPPTSRSTVMSEDRTAQSTSDDEGNNPTNCRNTPDISLHYFSDSEPLDNMLNKTTAKILALETPLPESVDTCDEFEARSTVMSEDRTAQSTSDDEGNNPTSCRNTPDISLHYSSDSEPLDNQPMLNKTTTKILAPETPLPESVNTCDEFEASLNRKVIPDSDSDENEDMPEEIVTSVRKEVVTEHKTKTKTSTEEKQKQTQPQSSMTFNVTNYNQKISTTNVVPGLQPSNFVYYPPQYSTMGQTSSVNTAQSTMGQTSATNNNPSNTQIRNLIQIANSVTQPVILVVPGGSAQGILQNPSHTLPQLAYLPQASTSSVVISTPVPQAEILPAVQPESLPQQLPTKAPDPLPPVQRESSPLLQTESLPQVPQQILENPCETLPPVQPESLPQVTPQTLLQLPTNAPTETLPVVQTESVPQVPQLLPATPCVTLPPVQPESLPQVPLQSLPQRGRSASSSSSCQHKHHCHSCNDSDHSHKPKKRKIIKIVKTKKRSRHITKSSGKWIVTDIETSDQEMLSTSTSVPPSSPSTSQSSASPRHRQSNVIAQEFERLASKGAYIINKKDK